MVGIKFIGGAPDFEEGVQLSLEDDVRKESLVVFENRNDGTVAIRHAGPAPEGEVYYVAPESTSEELVFVRTDAGQDSPGMPAGSGGDQPDDVRVALHQTFSNVAFYHRDTELPEAVLRQYRPGLILQEKGFVDCSYLEGGPAARHRYLILSSQAKDLHAVAGVSREYGPAIIARDAFFKVLNVYELRGHTQITLLHFPEELLEVLDRGPELNDAEQTMAQEARKHFEDRIEMPPSAPLTEPYWQDRIAFPIGVSDEGEPFYKHSSQDPG